MGKKKDSARKDTSATTGNGVSTADHVAAMSDAELAAEYAYMFRVVSESEEKLAKMPRPFPPEMRGYRSPAFHLYLDRKYLRRLTSEVLAREEARQESTEP